MARDIKEVLSDLLYEFEAEGAWSGHAYGFEVMDKYYGELTEYLAAKQIDYSSLERAHRNVMEEYDSLLDSDTKSFLNPADTEKLQKLDVKFLDKLAMGAQAAIWMARAEDKSFDPNGEMKFHEAVPCGGDEENVYMFYTYSSDGLLNTEEAVAEFGKAHFESCRDLPVNEIIDKHIYWATEPRYNGDTFVLFDDFEKLDDFFKEDASKYCHYYQRLERAKEKEDPQLPESPAKAVFRGLTKKMVSFGESQYGAFANISVQVPKSFSETGFASFVLPKGDVSRERGKNSYMAAAPSDLTKNVHVVRDGRQTTVRASMAEMAKLRGQSWKEYRARALPSVAEAEPGMDAQAEAGE